MPGKLIFNEQSHPRSSHLPTIQDYTVKLTSAKVSQLTLIRSFSSSTQLNIGDLKTSLRNNTIQLDIGDLTKISLRSLSVCQPTADIYWIKQGRINLWFIQVCHSYYKGNHIRNKWKKILRNRKFLQCKKHTSFRKENRSL